MVTLWAAFSPPGIAGGSFQAAGLQFTHNTPIFKLHIFSIHISRSTYSQITFWSKFTFCPSFHYYSLSGWPPFCSPHGLFWVLLPCVIFFLLQLVRVTLYCIFSLLSIMFVFCQGAQFIAFFAFAVHSKYQCCQTYFHGCPLSNWYTWFPTSMQSYMLNLYIAHGLLCGPSSPPGISRCNLQFPSNLCSPYVQFEYLKSPKFYKTPFYFQITFWSLFWLLVFPWVSHIA